MSGAPERLHVLVYGRVQGVFFRASTGDVARSLGLAGWVRNLPDGGVEAVAEGPRATLERFLDFVRRGPPAAKVERVEPTWGEVQGEPSPFEVRR